MIGFPVLRDGQEGRKRELYTERGPCTTGPRCAPKVCRVDEGTPFARPDNA
ncbi:hypothetical protein DMH15_26190 [Streptomyces sp. WAC 06725]|nr:hypothetical protein DMH15_26190 [Streptomyces sp. WAC 06725]